MKSITERRRCSDTPRVHAALSSEYDQLTESLESGTVPDGFDPASIISAMLDTGPGISDLVFSPGRPPQVERHGELVPVLRDDVRELNSEQTGRIAQTLMAGNVQAAEALRDEGAADFSYAGPTGARFRVNVFRQRGTLAIVMRVIASRIPTLAELRLPASLGQVAALKTGIVLVTGPTGSGKSSTLASLIDLINQSRAEHILTIEDPIEFLHAHKKATIHQRQLHTDTPSFALALRAALRQAPKVILVGEMRDRETVEIALTAAETGHLVLSTLHTIDTSKTVERVVGIFPSGDQQIIRTRLAGAFRYFIAQRLVPQRGGGRVAVLEVLKSTLRTREYIQQGEKDGKTLLDAIKDGGLDGMQSFDGEFERLIRTGVITLDTGLLYATNRGNLQVELADYTPDPADADGDSVIPL
jgi:twitching motility protein PilT